MFFFYFLYWVYLLNIWLIENLILWFIFLYKINMVCEFVRATQIALVYGFGGTFFFYRTWFFIYIFFHTEKNHIIRLYKVIKTKGREETIVHPHLLHYDSQCFAFFFFFLLVIEFLLWFFFQFYFCLFYLLILGRLKI